MGMLKVAICDDSPIISSDIENLLIEYTKKNSIRVIYDVYNSSLRLSDSLKEKKYDLFFLDIEMPEISGIELAKNIREYDMHANIIFVTNFSRYMAEVFEVNTFDYLLKPLDRVRFFSVVDRVCAFLDTDEQRFHFTSNSVKQIIPRRDIIYFEKDARYVLMHHTYGFYRIIKSTKELLADLDSNFIQIHTSYVINLKYLVRMTHDKAFLEYKEKAKSVTKSLPISRTYRNSSRQTASEFMKGKF